MAVRAAVRYAVSPHVIGRQQLSTVEESEMQKASVHSEQDGLDGANYKRLPVQSVQVEAQ